MFEAIPIGNGFTWRMICFAGRVLVYTDETFPSDMAASAAAKAWRTSFWAIADQVDHRMARCI